MKDINIEFADAWSIKNTYPGNFNTVDIQGPGGVITMHWTDIIDLMCALANVYKEIRGELTHEIFEQNIERN